MEVKSMDYSLKLHFGTAGIYVVNMYYKGVPIEGFNYKKTYIQYFIEQLKPFVSGGVKIRVTGVSRDEIRAYLDKWVSKFTRDMSAEKTLIDGIMSIFVFPTEKEMFDELDFLIANTCWAKYLNTITSK